MGKRNYAPSLKAKSKMMAEALKKAHQAKVPPHRLKHCKEASCVLLEIKSWLSSKEHLEQKWAECRTEEHNQLLRFIQWYLSWDGGDKLEKVSMRRILPLILRGRKMYKINWLKRLMRDLTKKDLYDPESNLRRPGAPWS